MAETSQTPWRPAWVRAVARRMKAWAESVLAEEPDSSATPGTAPRPESVAAGSRGAEGVAPPSPTAPEPSFEDLEARWLRDLEARRSVPLGDWVARVRRGAPRFLEEVQRDGLVPAPPRGARSVTGTTAHGPPPPAWTAPNELPPPPPPSPPDVQAEGGEVHARRESPPAIRSSSASRPSPPPAVPFWTAAPSPRPEADVARSAPSTPPSPEPRAAFRAPSAPERPPVGDESWPAPAPRAPPLHEAGAPVQRSPWDDFPPFASEGRTTRTPTRVPSPVPPRAEEESPSPTERVKVLPRPAPPRAQTPWVEADAGPRFAPREPPRNQVSSREDEGTWDGDRSPHMWRPRLVEAPPPTQPEFSATPDEPAAGPANPWPELPPVPVPESTETVVELRQWERRRRLDREQRGE
ncbi:hypothetical protein [Pyxidicoccus sp. MSG2]|uniref:hypothetical protein n=1 Tax=Pyxidicoccus sp. MSG2 TaxID=2996790 RepID=UPI0022705C31|nr:hypothetical protein [Pyxidicoccus sp. MSG2]MCY1019930.1 hypothetical protein [Pyxidicoccus sp. MSG2]